MSEQRVLSPEQSTILRLVDRRAGELRAQSEQLQQQIEHLEQQLGQLLVEGEDNERSLKAVLSEVLGEDLREADLRIRARADGRFVVAWDRPAPPEPAPSAEAETETEGVEYSQVVRATYPDGELQLEVLEGGEPVAAAVAAEADAAEE